ncbi:MAG: hypothetical protein Q9221_004615 [Calogaya cf. arnoldii]
MLNDVLSLCVGLWAVKVANDKASSKVYTYGWQRAETLGALVNGVFLVALCLSIFLDAIQRFVEPQTVSNPRLVLIVGCLGLASNIMGLFLFHEHGHSHGGHEHGHKDSNKLAAAEEGQSNSGPVDRDEHTHTVADQSGNVADVLPQNTIAGWPKTSNTAGSANGHGRKKSRAFSKHDEDASTATNSTSPIPARKSTSNTASRHHHHTSGSRSRFASADDINIHPASFRNDIIQASRMEDIESNPSEADDAEGALIDDEPVTEDQPLLGHQKSDGSAKPDLDGSPKSKSYDHADHKHSQPQQESKAGHSHGDLNMRGVFLHVMGDALGNIGVIGSALIIWLTSWSWRYYADPAISLVITVIILGSAIPLCRAASRILLQAVPPGINVDDIQADIQDLPGVISCHHLHIWQLSDTKKIASLHVQIEFDFKGEGSARYMQLARAIRRCLHAYSIHSSTIQPEFCLDSTHRHTSGYNSEDEGHGSGRSQDFNSQSRGASKRGSGAPSIHSAISEQDVPPIYRKISTMSAHRPAPLSIGQDYREPPRLLKKFHDAVRHVFGPYLLAKFHRRNANTGPIKGAHWQLRSIRNLSTASILIWMLALWWGEVGIFRNSITGCDWNSWEKWVSINSGISQRITNALTFFQPDGAAPHRMVLMADPQLVDPHTYPGRPWPLSTITRHHTDYYMRKSFTIIQDSLDPNTVFFLGDLFDGGREWLPPGTSGSDPRWRNYGEDYWIKEYKRFGNIFFNEWSRRASAGLHLDHRKMLVGLPGNHDLGLGSGIKLPVRRRFNAFFGDGNSVDVIGNHTFISLDTVSLSAKRQQDPATGRQGEGANREIWGPVEEFLDNVKSEKSRVLDRAVRMQNNKVENDLMSHQVLDIRDPHVSKSVHTASSSNVSMPSVLLTHVPLYRAKDTACGPLRERSPPSTKPSRDGEYLDKDPGNAIRVEYGFQYQNVLTPDISKEIIDKIGDVQSVFSGDDHDYCEVLHRGYTSPSGGIREITVKAFSWAMGVRRPGFLLLSLWNPLDEMDQVIHQSSDDSNSNSAERQHRTIQTHLCLLPNQLSIFIRYLVLLAVTLFALLVRAARARKDVNEHANKACPNGHVLPFTTKSHNPSTASANQSGLAVRSTAGRIRATSPYSFPGSKINDRTVKNYSGVSLHDDPLDERWGRGRSHDEDDDHPKRKSVAGSRLGRVWREFRQGVLLVGFPVGIWWIYLAGKF